MLAARLGGGRAVNDTDVYDHYEGLDSTVVTAVRDPQSPHDYLRLIDGEDAASIQQTTDEIEMTDNDYQNNFILVSRQL